METGHWLRRACRCLPKAGFVVGTLVCSVVILRAGPLPEPRVELDCKIVSSTGGVKYRPWVVDVRRANGDPVLQTVKGTGETIRLKDLTPAIYQLCITGTNGERCESVDLNLPANRSFFRFKRKLATPDNPSGSLAASGVSVADLAIPKDARSEMAQAEQDELVGKSDDAFHHLERALALHPNYPEALNNMGVHYYRTREFRKSVDNLRKATELSPNFYVAWANLGSSVLASGDFTGALKVNRRALELRPADARANLQLGLNFYYIRDYVNAKKYLNKAFKLDPASASSPQLFLAEIAIIEQDQADAERYIKGFLDLHPNSGVAPRLREVLSEVAARHFVSVPAIDLNLGP